MEKTTLDIIGAVCSIIFVFGVIFFWGYEVGAYYSKKKKGKENEMFDQFLDSKRSSDKKTYTIEENYAKITFEMFRDEPIEQLEKTIKTIKIANNFNPFKKDDKDK